jgi:hypothetical protein
MLDVRRSQYFFSLSCRAIVPQCGTTAGALKIAARYLSRSAANWHMATPNKLTRAEVYKQIDAFRGLSGRGADGKPSLEQWVAAKHVETKPPVRRAPGKAMGHGWSRIRTG